VRSEFLDCFSSVLVPRGCGHCCQRFGDNVSLDPRDLSSNPPKRLGSLCRVNVGSVAYVSEVTCCLFLKIEVAVPPKRLGSLCRVDVVSVAYVSEVTRGLILKIEGARASETSWLFVPCGCCRSSGRFGGTCCLKFDGVG
jgi:hypothetical protein